MLVIVPDIKETYDNIKILFELININNISFKFSSDLKLILLINGQQTATSMYPCPYCFVTLKDLRSNIEINAITNDSNVPSTLKKFGDLKTDYQKFVSLGKNKNLAKDCHSTINSPLFEESD